MLNQTVLLIVLTILWLVESWYSVIQQDEDTSFWYGSINRGYKAGGANTDGSLPDELRSFDPEYLT